jgi:hypothetical protein
MLDMLSKNWVPITKALYYKDYYAVEGQGAPMVTNAPASTSITWVVVQYQSRG